ncbi:hypothetical protein P4679_30745 [Priestia megaterium]|uniref:hypothetical protein n=1 Tax=Priestia megaterium TaxID=1404 RepID=UPI002E2203B0|nr:hypothetical protein [Priestia megaterium]
MTEIKEGQTKGEIKGRSLRIFDEDYKLFQELSKESGLTQADLMNEFRKSYERLKLESESSYRQSLEDLRSYSDKIINLFITLVNSTEDKISNEQDKAIEVEKELEKQIVMTKRAKDDSAAKIKFLENQVAELTVKLKEYARIDEMIDLRLKDKDELLESKDKEIANLHEELEEWKRAGENFERARVLNGEVKDKLTATEEELKLTQDQLRTKDFEMQEQLLALEKKHNEEIKALYKERAQEIKDAEERVRVFYEVQDNQPNNQKRTPAKKSTPKADE